MPSEIRNKELSERRIVTEKGSWIFVRYPKDICSKAEAWNHLRSHTPPGVDRSRRHYDNPWLRRHNTNHWGWSAPVDGGDISKELDAKAGISR